MTGRWSQRFMQGKTGSNRHKTTCHDFSAEAGTDKHQPSNPEHILQWYIPISLNLSNNEKTLFASSVNHQSNRLWTLTMGCMTTDACLCTLNLPNESSLLPLVLAAPVVQLQLLCPGQKSWAVCFLAPQGEVAVSPSKLQEGRRDKQIGEQMFIMQLQRIVTRVR